VQCVVTSPPYWGLRDYGTATWEGGDSDCDHVTERQPRNEMMASGAARRPLGKFHSGSNENNAAREPVYRDVCAKCGARRIDQSIGLEPTVDAYVERMVEVFREVRRVLRDDGTLWLNLGDAYATGGKHSNGLHGSTGIGRQKVTTGLKPKDLIGLPWRVAFALQADGWWLRSDIIWHKPNPMPESVTDRPTKAHEYVFLLTKSARYFWDADAVREQSEWVDADGHPVDSWGRRVQPPTHHLEGRRYSAPGLDPIKGGRGVPQSLGAGVTDGRRNARTVWTIATQPYPEAHFATFPQKLVEPCVLAGSREGDVVMDPFMGSGTVAHVAQRLNRRWLGCDLNPEYAELARDRAGTFTQPMDMTQISHVTLKV
jgi:DNA modification methylase